MKEKLDLLKKIAFGPIALAFGFAMVILIMGNRSDQSVIGLPVMIVFLWIPYLLPSYIAAKKDHPQFTGILVVNIITGFTVIGYVATLIWAFIGPKKIVENSELIENKKANDTKKCPYCAEEIKIEAKKCKHCGSEITV